MELIAGGHHDVSSAVKNDAVHSRRSVLYRKYSQYETLGAACYCSPRLENYARRCTRLNWVVAPYQIDNVSGVILRARCCGDVYRSRRTPIQYQPPIPLGKRTYRRYAKTATEIQLRNVDSELGPQGSRKFEHLPHCLQVDHHIPDPGSQMKMQSGRFQMVMAGECGEKLPTRCQKKR